MTCVGNSSDINQVFVIEPIIFGSGSTSPIVSACTGVFTNFISNCDATISISLESDRIIFSGDSYFIGSITGEIISGNTFYSGGTELGNIIQNYVIEYSGNTSGNCINNFYISNLYGCSPITLHNDIVPSIDVTIDLGAPIKRFRDINTLRGHSTLWTSTTSVTTATLVLGLDSESINRTITANNSIIRYDILDGTSY